MTTEATRELQPNNPEFEQAFLGSIIIDPHALNRVSTLVRPGDFFIERHAWIYQAMVDLHNAGAPVDLLTLEDRLTTADRMEDLGGPAFLTGLMNACPTSIHVEYYGEKIRKLSTLRRLIAGAGRIARLAHTEVDPEKVLALSQAIVEEIASELLLSGFKSAHDIAHRYMDRVEAMAGKFIGVSTGLPGLDELCGGLQPSDLILLAGRPGMMKTSVALKIARSLLVKGGHVAIFTLEMSDEQLVQRLISTETGLPVSRLRKGEIKDPEWAAFLAAQNKVSSWGLKVNDFGGISISQLRSQAKRLHRAWGIDFLIVDYLQLVTGPRSDNRVQEVSAIGRGLKNLAKELDIPVLAICNLSRACELRGDKRPILSDLRESGTLEYEADIVWFCYRDELYHPETEAVNILELIQAKWRHGPTGTHYLYCDKSRLDFNDAEKRVISLNGLQPVNDF